MIAPEQLAHAFVEMADTLVDEFDLIEFMQLLATRTSELVDARAAGLLLADPNGRLQLMAASDERAEMVELFQIQVHQGPCQDCYSSGTPVVNARLEVGRRTVAHLRTPSGVRGLPLGARVPLAPTGAGARSVEPLR